MDEPATPLIDDAEDPELLAEQPEPPAAEPQRIDSAKVSRIIIVLLLLSVLVLQVMQLQRSAETRDEVSALAEDVTDLKPLRRDVDILGEQLAALDGQLQAAVSAAGTSPAAIPAQAADGSLPAFQDSRNDPAVLGEMTLATINGVDYYTGTENTWSPGDGKARVWMIWAHWCPYCQSELPELAIWWPENAERFPNVELVTISSAIDDTRSNPLLPYLDEEQFPFPVVVDESGAVSQLFGTTAFPFWVVTDAEGRVVVRVAGALGTDSVDQIFTQLESMTSGA
ncbi:MAG: TlpA disulfide reductase family protein [Acidimicrobiia bacterium]|nr:TlpA disulfide reductase family protein [Acidimicrobiia bacterium]